MLETTHKVFHLQNVEKYSKAKVIQEALPTVLVSKKYSTIIFGKRCIQDLSMQGKFVRIMCDPQKRIIAWKMKDSITGGDSDNKNWRMINPKKNGSALLSIGPIIRLFNGTLKDDSYQSLLVKKNITPAQDMLNAGEVVWYVELKDKTKHE